MKREKVKYSVNDVARIISIKLKEQGENAPRIEMIHQILNLYAETVKEILLSGDETGIAGFGTFRPKRIAGRPYRSLYEKGEDDRGKIYYSEPSNKPFFEAAIEFRNALREATYGHPFE